ncbi:hypothetical protein E5163_04900 [Marinicauda algicola]|uniref:Uncharacterized protein n=1 Tax=Marinicauda algicola TaxID=2029849 RepID=A0A4S2H486_9PROT|nr:hypothetical protein [Marinicauda algicola]TGY90460.1 hypothetical protein E5163_04900 [Marinicauda algicola]
MFAHLTAALLAAGLSGAQPGPGALPVQDPATHAVQDSRAVTSWAVSPAFDGHVLDDVHDLSRLPALPAPVGEVRAGPGGVADFSASRAMTARADTVLALARIGRDAPGPVMVEIGTGTRAQIFVNDRLVRRIPGAGRQTLTLDLAAGRNTVILALSGAPEVRTASLFLAGESGPASW